MGTSFVDPTFGTCDPSTQDCSQLCDPTQDPTCGGFALPPMPPQQVCTDDNGLVVPCSDTGGGGVPIDGLTPGFDTFNPGVSAQAISWCQSNPGACDANGPTPANHAQFCVDNPSLCPPGPYQATPVGYQYPSSPTTGASPSTGSGAGNPTATSVASAAGSAAGGIAGLLSGIGSVLTSVSRSIGLGSCPAGYIKANNGTCIKGASTGTPITGGFLGTGLSTNSVAVLFGAIILIAIVRKKAA